MRSNFNHWAIQICQNQGFISSALSGKNTITFCNIWAIFAKKQGRVTNQRVRIKIWQILYYPHNSWSTFCKKILVPIFFSFVAIDHKGNFNFNLDFQIWVLFLVPCLHFFKKIRQNLMFNQLAPISNSKNEKALSS